MGRQEAVDQDPFDIVYLATGTRHGLRTIRVPGRERRDDILPLSEIFLKDIAKSFGRPPAGILSRGEGPAVAYGWPGNVRELRNILERVAIESILWRRGRDRIAGLSPRLSLRRAKTASPEPTRANSLDRRSDRNSWIY